MFFTFSPLPQNYISRKNLVTNTPFMLCRVKAPVLAKQMDPRDLDGFIRTCSPSPLPTEFWCQVYMLPEVESKVRLKYLHSELLPVKPGAYECCKSIVVTSKLINTSNWRCTAMQNLYSLHSLTFFHAVNMQLLKKLWIRSHWRRLGMRKVAQHGVHTSKCTIMHFKVRG